MTATLCGRERAAYSKRLIAWGGPAFLGFGGPYAQPAGPRLFALTTFGWIGGWLLTYCIAACGVLNWGADLSSAIFGRAGWPSAVAGRSGLRQTKAAINQLANARGLGGCRGRRTWACLAAMRVAPPNVLGQPQKPDRNGEIS